MAELASRPYRLLAVVVLCAVPLTADAGTTRWATREVRMQRLIELLSTDMRQATNAAQRDAVTGQVAEIQFAFSNNFRPPVPPAVDIITLPYVHYRYASARVGLGTVAATNLCGGADTSVPGALDREDPLPSTFWRKPGDIPTANLLTGFDRAARPAYENSIWSYSSPKTGYGGHAGFEARDGPLRIKIKFGEVHSEPFTARIFHALGYNADPTDFSPGLKIRYDRRIFTEFNSRWPVKTHVRAFGILPVWTIQFQPRHDPFTFIASAHLVDGRDITTQELRGRLLHDGLFDANFEKAIEFVVTAAANVQPRVPGEQTIGPWDFGQLGHERQRELRAAGLLSAWLGWFDSRFENTRLKVIARGKTIELKHYFSDLGGGLGRGVGLLSRRPEDPAAFPWTFTEPERRQGPHQMTIPFRIVNFRPIEPTPAFASMTPEDARWMARLIAQFTPGQLCDALRAAGCDHSMVDLYAAKLLARREKMLSDLGLSGETATGADPSRR